MSTLHRKLGCVAFTGLVILIGAAFTHAGATGDTDWHTLNALTTTGVIASDPGPGNFNDVTVDVVLLPQPAIAVVNPGPASETPIFRLHRRLAVGGARLAGESDGDYSGNFSKIEFGG